ncbi:aminotransferase class IV [Bacteroidota bacterium]
MSLLLETIKIENRSFRNAEFHNQRMNRARKDLFGITSKVDIHELIKIPKGMGMGTFKCRILYDDKIREIQLLPYQTRSINSLKLVVDNDIDYQYKYSDRSLLENLLLKRDTCDDILIIKNGCVSDTFSANILFQSHEGHWFTPDTPLMRGTMRQFLLDEGRISEKRIRPENFDSYTQVRLVNCLMDMETGPSFPIKNIHP